jgi:SAM-dependent methyltransferase
MTVNPRALAGGMLSFVLPMARRVRHAPLPPRYFYGVFLRHLVAAHGAGARPRLDRFAELGPGTALGTCIAALLAGAERAVALDIAPYTDLAGNEPVLDALVGMFRARAPIPDPSEFPNLKPLLDDYGFPHALLPDAALEAALDDARVERIRAALHGRDDVLRYVAPWHDARTAEPGTLDWIVSQAVMEHVDDLDGAYRAMARWLAPGGIASHAIDFTSHGFAREWNGHWALSETAWRLSRGRRQYALNRAPHSRHLALARDAGLAVVADRPMAGGDGIGRAALAPAFRRLSEGDLGTRHTFLVLAKPTG